jgi:hypothetical protein
MRVSGEKESDCRNKKEWEELRGRNDVVFFHFFLFINETFLPHLLLLIMWNLFLVNSKLTPIYPIRRSADDDDPTKGEHQ